MANAFEEWSDSFRNEVKDLPDLDPDDYEAGAQRLRQLLKSKVLMMNDLVTRPERFFAAHRLLSELAIEMNPGFFIRCTVQFNLFAGTILALGNRQQVGLLRKFQDSGRLGCFALTEKLAGVNSGLIVNTTCTFDPETQQYALNTPNRDAEKNWISQGLTADMAVVMATLLVNGRSVGPHAFLVQLRNGNGQLLNGVHLTDMGPKTIGDNLDNAAIAFDNVALPKSALLNRHADVVMGKAGEAQYVQRSKAVRSIDMIGQRLYTGRAVIAASALVFARSLFDATRKYSDAKRCWSPSDDGMVLSAVPQLHALYAEAEGRLSRLERFVAMVEAQLADSLRPAASTATAAGTVTDADKAAGSASITPRPLVEAISAAKVVCVETAIELTFRLKQELGSYALMAGSGFERLDYLNCCKFAEGDSRILMQKMARDKMSAFARASKATPAADASGRQRALAAVCDKQELALVQRLGEAVERNGRAGWEEGWRDVYRLAELSIEHTLDDWLGAQGQEHQQQLAKAKL